MKTNDLDPVVANTDEALKKAAENLATANGVGHGDALVGMILRGIDAVMDIEPASTEEMIKSRMDLNYARLLGGDEKIKKGMQRHDRAVMAFRASVQERLRGGH